MGRAGSDSRYLTAVLVAVAICVANSGRAEKQQEMSFAPEKVEKTRPQSKTMTEALEAYAREDYYKATIALRQVIDGKSHDSAVHRQRSVFWMGKALYHLGFYSAALSYFDRIVKKGEEHRYYSATLKWLVSLSQKLPETAGILERIGKYGRAQLEQPSLAPVRGDLFYLLGRYYYAKGDFDEAIRLFVSVPPDSPSYARAKFMEGIAHVRKYEGKPAAVAFKEVLRAARRAPDTNEIKRFEQLALISLARVFYSTRQFDLSVKYYNKIPRTSPHWLPALFESSWAYFMRNNFSQALGNIHTLNAPYFEDRFFPESLVLRAVIYWKNCLYDRSEAAIQEFEARYPALKKAVDALIQRFEDPAEVYDYVVKLRKQAAGLSGEVRALVLGVVDDKQVATAFGYVDEIDRQLATIDAANAEWKTSEVATKLIEDLTLQRSLAQNAAGELAKRRLERLSREINDLRKQAIKVQYEIISGKKNRLEATLRNEQVVAAPERTSSISVDDEHLLWPFDGEYWRDELGYYRFKIASKCTR